MLDSSGMCTSKSLIILHRRKRSRGATAKHNEVSNEKQHTRNPAVRERESTGRKCTCDANFGASSKKHRAAGSDAAAAATAATARQMREIFPRARG